MTALKQPGINISRYLTLLCLVVRKGWLNKRCLNHRCLNKNLWVKFAGLFSAYYLVLLPDIN